MQAPVPGCLPVNKSTAVTESGLPTRMQADDTSLPLGWDTGHFTRATSGATGLSQSMLPLAPDTAATKAQGEDKPGGERRGAAGWPQPVLRQPSFPTLHSGHRPHRTACFLYPDLVPGAARVDVAAHLQGRRVVGAEADQTFEREGVFKWCQRIRGQCSLGVEEECFDTRACGERVAAHGLQVLTLGRQERQVHVLPPSGRPTGSSC